jgi:hypothetical protein
MLHGDNYEKVLEDVPVSRSNFNTRIFNSVMEAIFSASDRISKLFYECRRKIWNSNSDDQYQLRRNLNINVKIFFLFDLN